MPTKAAEHPPSTFLKGAIPDGPLRYPREPARFGKSDIEPFFLWAAEQHASDISIQSNEQVFLKIHGRLHRVTARRLTQSELTEIAAGLFESDSAKTELAGINALDFSYTARPDRSRRVRFRINATALSSDGTRGTQITARTIPSMPPKMDELGIEEEIRRAFAPKQGLVVITGATGSGKSTLLAAGIRDLAEDPDGHRKIITYEAPIEYVYDEVECPTTLISQHEIGVHLANFADAIRNALRRAPNIILVGEARDAETIGEAITASSTGHLVYTTVHSNGFADTIRRMVNVFPEGEKNARATDIAAAIRMIVSQRLIPATDGRQVAIREYVIFNEEIVDQILDGGIANITATCRDVLRKHGRSFLQDAREKLREGRISQATFNEVARGSRGEDQDAVEVAEHAIRRVSATGAVWSADLSLPPVGDE
jgi:defect-in-organelle-trafficking protein DotB